MGDSHTCTLGAFGAFAAGVGTTDLEVGILKGVCAFKNPQTIRIDITGRLRPGVFAKDVILSIIGRIGVGNATHHVIEFAGPTIDAMSMEARMTLCNMAVEAGATSGICAPDATTVAYLWEFIKDEFVIKQAALEAYRAFAADPDAAYETVIEHRVDDLTPQTTDGFRPDNVKPVDQMAGTPVDQVYIGSCTNGRIEDLWVAAAVLKGKKVNAAVRGILSPATPQVYNQALEEGLITVFMDAGFCVTNPTCGACLGMSTGVLAEGEVCAATTNRNFYGRMGRSGMAHLMCPATAAATAITGQITNSDQFIRY